MNAMTKFNVLDIDSAAPIFPMLKVSRSSEITIEDNEVTFSLIQGEHAYINVTVEANTVSDEMGIQQSSDPQSGFYMDFDVLEVAQDAVGIVSDFDEIYAVRDMPVRLTSDQVEQLNQLLKEMAEKELLQDMAA